MIDRPRTEGTDLREELGALGDEARALASSLNRIYDETCSTVCEQARVRPYTLLGVAAGAGFILGGGLPKVISRTIVAAAMRAGISLAVSKVVAGVSGEGMARDPGYEPMGGET